MRRKCRSCKACKTISSVSHYAGLTRSKTVDGDESQHRSLTTPPGPSAAPTEQSDVMDNPTSPFPLPVLLTNNKYLARYPVPNEKRSWKVELPGYAPIMFSAPELYTIGREKKDQLEKLYAKVRQDGTYETRMCYYPPFWADPELYGMTQEDRDIYFQFNQKTQTPYHKLHGDEHKKVDMNRVSYLGTYQLHPITGAPLNPTGRTGMIGRGLLGKYGPNHAADPVVTCFADNRNQRILQLALIERSDTKQYALPGGMVDPGEIKLSGTAIREFCEEALEGNDNSALRQRRDEMVDRFNHHMKSKDPIISKVVDDPRNTDNAWMETQAFWFHFNSESDLGRKLKAGDDAIGARWVQLNESFDVNKLYADHSEIVIQLFKILLQAPDLQSEFSGIVVPHSIKTKMSAVPPQHLSSV